MSAPTALPARLGSRYVLLKPLGRGGTGRVFLAYGGGRICTIKTLRDLGRETRTSSAEPIDANLVRRFSDEARLVTQLHHPNLIYVAEAGVEQGDPFLAMEYLPGRSLRHVWRRCAEWRMAFPIGIAFFVARELLRGLAYIHDFDDQALVHRDVNPGTVLLSFEGEVKLADFGLARWRDRLAKTLVTERWAAGPYHSPEQRRGEPLDRRSDLFAVGAILWELLTGRPFEGGERPSPPSRLAPHVPPEVDALVMTALAPAPAQRFETADAFSAALTRLMSASCDAAQLKSFLVELFEEEREHERLEERRLVKVARALLAQPLPAPPAEGPAPPAALPPGAPVAPPTPAPPSPIPPAGAPSAPSLASITASASTSPGRRGRRWALVGVAAAPATAVGMALRTAQRGGDRAAPPPTGEPRSRGGPP